MALQDHVLAYYRLLDNKQVDELLTLYADNIVYNRCGIIIEGMADLSHFFHNERAMDGVHTAHEVHEIGREVIVRGSFAGQNGKGEPHELQFAEFYYFDDQDKICRRESYLATGFEQTK